LFAQPQPATVVEGEVTSAETVEPAPVEPTVETSAEPVAAAV